MTSKKTHAMKLGLEVIQKKPLLAKKWGRCGLLCNQASVDINFSSSWDILAKILKRNLVALFSPQHGFYATLQYNMEESRDSIHPDLKIPIYSLYSETREPTARMLEHLDTIIVDLQITGCRIYTFKQTIAAVMRAAKKYGKRVVILDRPNPVGGVQLEGRVLDRNITSFVGEFPIPMRHGLTPGECANFFNSTIGCDLEIIKMQKCDAKSLWRQTGRPWVILTPGVPTIDAIDVYPGGVLIEGTNLSEGRGTTVPFQFIGAPYIKSSKEFKARILDYLRKSKEYSQGFFLREVAFQPTFNKWKSQECRGVQIHVTDPHKIRSYPLTLVIIQAARDLGGPSFAWEKPPYEYVYDIEPIKLLIGSHDTLKHFENFSVKDSFWSEGIADYKKLIKPFLLYPRIMRD